MTDNSLDRRSLFKLGLGAAALGLGAVTLERFSPRDKDDQELALERLFNPNELKRSFRIANHKEITESKGLAVRSRRLDSTEIKDPPKPLFRLMAGSLIKDAVYMEGYDPELDKETDRAWLAYRIQDDTGATHAGFVANRPQYLEPLPYKP